MQLTQPEGFRQHVDDVVTPRWGMSRKLGFRDQFDEFGAA